MIPHARQLRGPALAFVAAIAPGALAQPADAPDRPADLSAIVKDLDAAPVQTRIDAQSRLASDSSISLRQIEDAIRSGGLSAEQRERLTAAAYKHFTEEPRGALGVQGAMDFTTQTRGALLQRIEQGFPASTILRPNDRVIAADGQTIDTFESLRPVIVAHDPGDEMSLTLVRDGATLNLKVKLASFADLKPINPQALRNRPDDGVMALAWALRSKPYETDPAAATPIAVTFPPGAWNQAGYDDADAPRGRVLDSDAAHTGVVAGGEARGGTLPMVQPATQNLTARPLDAQIQILQPPPGADAAEVQARIRLQSLRLQRESEATILSQLRQRLLDTKIPDDERKRLGVQYEMIRQQLRSHDAEIQKLSTEIFKRK